MARPRNAGRCNPCGTVVVGLRTRRKVLQRRVLSYSPASLVTTVSGCHLLPKRHNEKVVKRTALRYVNPFQIATAHEN